MTFKEELLIKAMEIIYNRSPINSTHQSISEKSHDLVNEMLKNK